MHWPLLHTLRYLYQNVQIYDSIFKSKIHCAVLKQETVEESSLIPAFPFSIDFNWVKNVFTLALCEAALACRTFARLSKCSFLASPSFLWLRSRNSSSWSFNFSAAREQERKSFKYSLLTTQRSLHTNFVTCYITLRTRVSSFIYSSLDFSAPQLKVKILTSIWPWI